VSRLSRSTINKNYKLWSQIF